MSFSERKKLRKRTPILALPPGDQIVEVWIVRVAENSKDWFLNAAAAERRIAEFVERSVSNRKRRLRRMGYTQI